MTEERVKRKLSAIFSADVEGYSRLMGDDEASTVRTLESYRKLMSGLIDQYRGRVVDSPGDNLLAEFGSVVDAVQCAVEIQEVLTVKNEELPENRKMQFRIGVNLGDVIEEGDRIYGDGVNIAARIEGLAEAGGICISGSAHEQIKTKLVFGYEYIGEHSVKNIAEPLKVYRIPMRPKDMVGKVSREKEAGPKRWRWAILGGVVALILVIGAVAIWNFYLRRPSVEPASLEKMAYPLPDKPSIAVLPFVNMSGDPEQEYFSDGITEDLITDLSKVSNLFVIARNSVFTYKNKPAKIQDVSKELGVRYVLEGSVRKAGNRVRITSQLIDAISGGHLWAERYDRVLEDIFAVQDEVTREIVAVLAIKLGEGEQKEISEKHTLDMVAYDYFLRGKDSLHQFTRASLLQARELFQEAINRDPAFAMAYANLGATYLTDWKMGWSRDEKSLDHALELAQKAVSMRKDLPETYGLLGYIYLWKRQHDKAIELYEKVIKDYPNYADGFANLGAVLNFAGRPKTAIGFLEKAMRLDPLYPGVQLFNLGHSYFLTERHGEAIDALKNSLDENPDFLLVRIYLAAIYADSGREKEAYTEAAEIRNRNPEINLEIWEQRLPYKNRSDAQRIIELLKEAGLN